MSLKVVSAAFAWTRISTPLLTPEKVFPLPEVPTEIALENYKERLQTTDADEAADLPDRLDKADAFNVLQEGVDVATRIADEALVDLLFLRNVERRVVVVVERAEADVVASALDELNVF